MSNWSSKHGNCNGTTSAIYRGFSQRKDTLEYKCHETSPSSGLKIELKEEYTDRIYVNYAHFKFINILKKLFPWRTPRVSKNSPFDRTLRQMKPDHPLVTCLISTFTSFVNTRPELQLTSSIQVSGSKFCIFYDLRVVETIFQVVTSFVRVWRQAYQDLGRKLPHLRGLL